MKELFATACLIASLLPAALLAQDVDLIFDSVGSEDDAGGLPDENGPDDLSPSCEDSWVRNLSTEDPLKHLEVMSLIGVLEHNNRITQDGLAEVVCIPDGVDRDFDQNGVVDTDAVGQFFCENPAEVELQSLPNTYACELAEREMRETGLGSLALGVEPNPDTQISVIAGILTSRDVFVDGEGFSLTTFIIGAIAGGIVYDKAKEGYRLAEEFAENQRQQYRTHQIALAQDRLSQASQNRQDLTIMRDRQRAALDSGEGITDDNREVNERIANDLDKSVESATDAEEDAGQVLESVRNGSCADVDKCGSPLINGCVDEVCLENAIAQRFGDAERVIQACERQVNPVDPFPNQTPDPNMTQSVLTENLMGNCRVLFVEDSCMAAGDPAGCPDDGADPHQEIDVIEINREQFVNRVLRGGNVPCPPDDSDCEIAVKLQQGIELTDVEKRFANARCGIEEELDFEIPGLPAEIENDLECRFTQGRQVCGEEAACISFLWSRPDITRWNYRVKMFQEPQCLAYESVNDLIDSRFAFNPLSEGSPFANGASIDEFPEEFQNPIAELAEKFEVDPEDINVTRAGQISALASPNDPLITLVLGMDDEDGTAFQSFVCERL